MSNLIIISSTSSLNKCVNQDNMWYSWLYISSQKNSNYFQLVWFLKKNNQALRAQKLHHKTFSLTYSEQSVFEASMLGHRIHLRKHIRSKNNQIKRNVSIKLNKRKRGPLSEISKHFSVSLNTSRDISFDGRPINERNGMESY